VPVRLSLLPAESPRALSRLFRIASALGILLCALAPSAPAQETSAGTVEEIVANLAAGRVIIAVVKDVILIATLEDPIEVQTRPPIPVQLSSKRAGIILGPVEWFSPSSQQELAQINRELPHLRAREIANTPHLGQTQEGAEATDIEAIGQGLLERLNHVVQDLHERITLPAGEPFVELIVADFQPGYGPEVWQLTYSLKQSPERGDFWDTHVLRPVYLQYWPPEKGQLHTLVEFHYPPGDATPTLLDLLRQNDPRLQRIRTDPKMAEVAQRFLDGQSGKIPSGDATQFLRAALEAIAPPKARETMASIGFETGFDWILQPPPEPERLPSPKEKERPADAPTLRHPSE
jgi:hypothetical protein